MMSTDRFRAFVESADFLSPLGLPSGTVLEFTLLGQGEYNINYAFFHPAAKKKLVLRINTASQLHLPHQVEYEFAALRELETSGRTPHAYFCDDSRRILPYGALVMDWLRGRPLDYRTDLPAAAAILADIHAAPVAPETALLSPAYPLQAVYDECLDMAARYLRWSRADVRVCGLLEQLIRAVGALPLKSVSAAPRCMVNTELNSGNFLINETGPSYLIDWEKPLLSEPAQDLGHFLAPTTTFWKTDVILTPEEIAAFVRLYVSAAAERLDLQDLRARLPLFFTVTCLRGVTWCSMALVEYASPGRALRSETTLQKLRQYLSEDFLENLLETYVRRDFLKGGRG